MALTYERAWVVCDRFVILRKTGKHLQKYNRQNISIYNYGIHEQIKAIFIYKFIQTNHFSVKVT